MIVVLLNLILTPYLLAGAPIVLRVTMQSSDILYGIGMGLINFVTILGALSIDFFRKKMRLKSLYRWILVSALLMILMTLSLISLMLIPTFIVGVVTLLLGVLAQQLLKSEEELS